VSDIKNLSDEELVAFIKRHQPGGKQHISGVKEFIRRARKNIGKHMKGEK
jgi:hypothetical protein